MSHPNKSKSKTTLLITAMICATLVISAGIAAFVYVNQQNLNQQKQLKEAEIRAENERAEKQRETDEANSRRECIGNSVDSWGRIAC